MLTASRAALRASPPGAASSSPWWPTFASASVHLAIVAITGLLLVPRLVPPPRPSAYTVIWTARPPSPPPTSAALPAPAPAGQDSLAPVPVRPSPPLMDAGRELAVRRSAAAPQARPAKPRPTAPAAEASRAGPALPERRAAKAPAPQKAPDSVAAPDDAWLAAFTAQVQAAVQQAASYPMPARRAHAEGRVQVGFDYAGGVAANPTVLVSSRTPMLDKAAVKALVSARYPAPPPALGGNRVRLVVWVDFRMSPEE